MGRLARGTAARLVPSGSVEVVSVRAEESGDGRPRQISPGIIASNPRQHNTGGGEEGEGWTRGPSDRASDMGTSEGR